MYPRNVSQWTRVIAGIDVHAASGSYTVGRICARHSSTFQRNYIVLNRRGSRALWSAVRKLFRASEADTDFSSAPPVGEKSVTETGEKGVVLKQPIPQNYIEETLTPHLENQIVNKALSMNANGLVRVAEAYSKVPVRQIRVSKHLAKVVEHRWDDFTHDLCVKILNPVWVLLGPHDGLRLFRMIAHRLNKHIDELSGFSCIGILRIYSKLEPPERPEPFFSQEIVPRAWNALGQLHPVELSDTLATISHHAHGSEKEILELVLVHIEKKYEETSLLHTILNLSSLCRLKIYHESLMQLATKDLTNPARISGLPAHQLALVVWVYKRFGKLDLVLESLLPIMEDKMEAFTVNEFARLCRALPKGSSIPERICLNLRSSISDMPRRDFSLFFSGCVSRRLFPLVSESTESNDEGDGGKESLDVSMSVNREELWDSCLGYLEGETPNIAATEATRFIQILRFSRDHRHLISQLPPGWNALIKDELDRRVS